MGSYCGIFGQNKNFRARKKQPLLAKSFETSFVSGQRLGKHVHAATDTYATIGVLLETVFFNWSVPKDYKEGSGSNTSTVTLRVVGGDKKGSLESETVKYGRESHGTRTRERLR
jgi:hypothetical protein